MQDCWNNATPKVHAICISVNWFQFIEEQYIKNSSYFHGSSDESLEFLKIFKTHTVQSHHTQFMDLLYVQFPHCHVSVLNLLWFCHSLFHLLCLNLTQHLSSLRNFCLKVPKLKQILKMAVYNNLFFNSALPSYIDHGNLGSCSNENGNLISKLAGEGKTLYYFCKF